MGADASGGADSRRTVCGGILEHPQGRVGLEGVRDVLCRLSIKAVVAQTASEAKKETSGGADSSEKGLRLRTLAFATLSCS